MTQDVDAAPDGSSRPAPAAPEPAPPGPVDHPRPEGGSGPPPTGPPDDQDPDGDDPGGWGREAGWVRPFLIGAAVLGLLLLGAAAGLLIGLPNSTAPVVPTADSVDVGFAQDMSVHHQQAVEMAAWERDHSTDPVLRQLASDIETTQNSQIGRMQGWLDLWDAPTLPVGGHMAWMSDPTHDHGAGPGTGVATMPGMASAADLTALRAATGSALDVEWLQLMLRHHQGAVGMLQYAAAHAAVPQLRNLATQMLTSQTAEAEYLQQLLTQRGGQPLPPP
jgi:uncharacterized protein (DUF305 family)